jgi:hypothetical protein
VIVDFKSTLRGGAKMIDIEKALQDIANVIGILAGAITIAKLLKGKAK